MSFHVGTEMNTEESKENHPVGAVLVVGGGIGGMQASLDLAESGFFEIGRASCRERV